jgi:hypothetical protein
MKPSHKEPNSFAPIPLRSRHDGWTAERQTAFIEALAESACVEEACRRVGMSDSSAYRLRRHPEGALFREAWDAALDYGIHRLEQAALSRALNGVARPIFRSGEQVGEWRYYDERLTMFLLKSRRPARFGKWMDKLLPPDLLPQGEADYDLHAKLDEIQVHADDEQTDDEE